MAIKEIVILAFISSVLSSVMTVTTPATEIVKPELDTDDVTALIVGEIPPEALPHLEGKLIMVSREKNSEPVKEMKLWRNKRLRRSPAPRSTTEPVTCKFNVCKNEEHTGKCITLLGGTIACRTDTHLSFESDECNRLNWEAEMARRNLTGTN